MAYIGLSNLGDFGQGDFGQADEGKEQITAELLALEESGGSPVALVRGAKALLAKLRQMPRWSDSRSGISASFLNLVRDDETHRAYLKSTDISARATALMTEAATRLTPAQAQQEGVSGLQRVSATAASEHLSTTQRLSRPGGEAWEVARETPKPFVEEAVRRGGQVKRVGGKIVDEVAPIGQGIIDELDEKGITNPLLGATSLGLLIFMKNKILAVVIILVLVYLTKQRQLSEAKDKIYSVTDRVQSVAEKVEATAERFS